MAANKCTISVSASVMPDNIRKNVSGTALYDLNDVGDNNRWIYFLNGVTSNATAIPDGVNYLRSSGNSSDSILDMDSSADRPCIIVIKHTGYQPDGTTKTADNHSLYVNVTPGTAAQAAAGNLILNAGEVFWARLFESEMDDITLLSSSGGVNVEIYAICDDAA